MYKVSKWVHFFSLTPTSFLLTTFEFFISPFCPQLLNVSFFFVAWCNIAHPLDANGEMQFYFFLSLVLARTLICIMLNTMKGIGSFCYRCEVTWILPYFCACAYKWQFIPSTSGSVHSTQVLWRLSLATPRVLVYHRSPRFLFSRHLLHFNNCPQAIDSSLIHCTVYHCQHSVNPGDSRTFTAAFQ